MTKSTLLLNEYPLMVFPSFAAKFGLYESIILQQVHYWLVHNEKQDINYHDGRYWVFNSYPEWNKQFPFMRDKTLRVTFKRLEIFGLLLTGNYNKLAMDRTKWYTIDYDRINLLNSCESVNFTTCKRSELPEQVVDFTAPIPETTSETTTETTNNRAVPCRTGTTYKRNPLIVRVINKYRKDMYKDRFNSRHASLTNRQYDTVYDNMHDFANTTVLEYDDWINMLDIFLKSKRQKSDCNIMHFATQGIMEYCACESGVIPDSVRERECRSY